MKRRICEITGCDGNYYMEGMCRRHFLHMRLHGKILDNDPICSIEGCTGKVKDLGLCEPHYQAKALTLEQSEDVSGTITCQVPGCTAAKKAQGYCNRHYHQVRTHGVVQVDKAKLPTAICLNPTCDTPVHAKGLCSRHYSKMRRKLVRARG